MPKYRNKTTGKTTICGEGSAYQRIAQAHPDQFEEVAAAEGDSVAPDENTARRAAEQARAEKLRRRQEALAGGGA